MNDIIYNVNPDNIETILNIVIGACLGGIITYFFSIRAIKRETFNQAAAKFRAAFVETESVVNPRFNIKNNYVYGEFVHQQIEPYFIVQERAAIEFRYFLPKSKRRLFQQTWEEYAYPDYRDFPESPRLSYYSNHVDEQEKVRLLVQNKLTKLFEFAEFK